VGGLCFQGCSGPHSRHDCDCIEHPSSGRGLARTAGHGQWRLAALPGDADGRALPAPAGAVFQTGFHFVVGLAMALFYALVLEPWIRAPSWLRGVLFATAVWLINAFIVLPSIGEGIAGSRNLTLAGMVWFAAAHTLFFLVLGTLFDRLQSVRAAKE
jgi:hypothetical protein